MTRLLRPHIGLDIKLLVCMRMLGSQDPPDLLLRIKKKRARGQFHKLYLGLIAMAHGCDVSDLRLDHDPALGARRKVYRDGTHVDYDPPANDPAHLIYRPHGPQFDGSHLVKTNVRGEHGQHPDRVLIKKNRRLEQKEAEREGRAPARKPKFKAKIPQRKKPWPKRPFPKRPR